MCKSAHAERATSSLWEEMYLDTLITWQNVTRSPHAGKECAPDAGAPLERQLEGSPGGMIDTKVEQEAADGRNDHESCDRILLQAKRRDTVDGPQEQPKGVEGRHEGAKVGRRQ